MISVSEAKKKIEQLFFRSDTATLSLYEAVNLYLAIEINALTDVPQFDNSAMDGYAFSFGDWKGQALQLVGESAAGEPSASTLKPGEAMRIFTGAMVPDGADTVVMQEKTRVENGKLIILDEKIIEGSNVRLQASQTKKGAVVAGPGDLISPGMAGYLAGLGVAEAEVYQLPKAAIVVTGNELIKPGENLKPGQIYESNSHAIYTALKEVGVDSELFFCRDSESEISDTIQKALKSCNLLILTGGVSVGDYDFVVPMLKKQGVEEIFYGVKQKPAKPLFTGVKDRIPVFGLPGNPASVLTSFYVYVLPVIRFMMGNPKPWPDVVAELSEDFHRKAGLTQFLKGRVENGVVTILPGQESYRMDGFARANCLIEIPEYFTEAEAGDMVNIIPFRDGYE